MGKTLLLWSEQGFGDMLQFFRYVSIIKQLGARVIVDVQAALVPLLAAQNIADAVYAAGDPLPAFDFHLALMSVPRVLRTTLQTVPNRVPYLRPAKDRTAYWTDRLRVTNKRKIGIAWAGRPEHPNDRRRSISPALLQPLAAADVTFITVQPRPPTVAIPPFPMLDFGIELTDFADTAALISQLDLLISVDTSVAHLAGALGIPVWLLLPFAPDWRWLMHRADTPWYPSMRLFRQPKLGDWAAVVERVTKELRQ